MADNTSLLAVFPDLEPAADAIDKLRSLGVSDEQMNVISGVPVTEAMLGRPHQWTNVPRLAMGGAIGGFLIGVFLVFTPLIYFVPVGGQPEIPGPPSVVVLFELTMLGMLISTFVGFSWASKDGCISMNVTHSSLITSIEKSANPPKSVPATRAKTTSCLNNLIAALPPLSRPFLHQALSWLW